MVGILGHHAADPGLTNSYANAFCVRVMERSGPPSDPRHQLAYETSLIAETILSGDVAGGVQRLEAFARRRGSLLDADRSMRRWYERQSMVAGLRKGEDDNCVARHTVDSCIFPVAEGGAHQNKAGVMSAQDILRRWLADDPTDMEARWLFNLTAMLLGSYPDGVPSRWLIKPSAFESDAPFPRFVDVAARAGVATVGHAGGVAMDDFDGDGDLDIVASSHGFGDQLRFLVNDGAGKFTDRTSEAGLDGLFGGLNVTHADYDNDGDVDVFVLRGAWLQQDGHVPNSLLRNEGGGRFVDVTVEAGVFSRHPTQTAVFADFDNDGWLDLFVGNENGHGHEHRAELYRNTGDGRFTEIAIKAGVDVTGYVKAVTAGDYDNDGWMDLYVSRLRGRNSLLRNRGDGTFEDVTAQAKVGGPDMSFPVWFFDYDHDGWLDLFVSGYEASPADVANDYLERPHKGVMPALYRNLGDGTFEDVAAKVGLDTVLWTMGCNYGDLDHDGWLDLYIGTGESNLTALVPNRMFRGTASGRFSDVTTAGGFGHLQKGHGVAFGDVDGDGDQDVFAVMGGFYDADVFTDVLFENPGTEHHWLGLELRGKSANRGGIGARITVRAGGSTWHSVVSTGGSFGSGPVARRLGVGSATTVDEIVVRWPGSAEAQTVKGLAVDRVHVIEQR